MATATAPRIASHKARVGKARAAKDAMIDRIYALAPSSDVPFSECLKLASHDMRETFYASQVALINAEEDAVSAGKAYRASFGLLIWNR
jgi:hypothetical protein